MNKIWVWNIGRIKPTAQYRLCRRKAVSVTPIPRQIPRGQSWDRNRASEVCGLAYKWYQLSIALCGLTY